MLQNALAIFFSADETCAPIKPGIVENIPCARDAVTDTFEIRRGDEPSGLPSQPTHDTTSAPAQPPVTAPGKAVFSSIHISFLPSALGVFM
jgi:hypothetical protein